MPRIKRLRFAEKTGMRFVSNQLEITSRAAFEQQFWIPRKRQHRHAFARVRRCWVCRGLAMFCMFCSEEKLRVIN